MVLIAIFRYFLAFVILNYGEKYNIVNIGTVENWYCIVWLFVDFLWAFVG